jgi:hypothetical protein
LTAILSSVNTEDEIQDRTRTALDAIRPWRDQSVSGLTGEAKWANWRETARQAIGDAAVGSGLLGLDGVDIRWQPRSSLSWSRLSGLF